MNDFQIKYGNYSIYIPGRGLCVNSNSKLDLGIRRITLAIVKINPLTEFPADFNLSPSPPPPTVVRNSIEEGDFDRRPRIRSWLVTFFKICRPPLRRNLDKFYILQLMASVMNLLRHRHRRLLRQ